MALRKRAAQAGANETEGQEKCHVVAKFPSGHPARSEVRFGRTVKFMNVIMDVRQEGRRRAHHLRRARPVEKKSGKDPLEMFNVALNNIRRWSR